ncbi:hypothetical protein R1flu_024857 [Riccia fluitans]|uniref:Uncharacterized protein n=1 Tax=Riccia fluitans TaxID=41844 RepID=A0ABD1XWI4_9MARC
MSSSGRIDLAWHELFPTDENTTAAGEMYYTQQEEDHTIPAKQSAATVTDDPLSATDPGHGDVEEGTTLPINFEPELPSTLDSDHSETKDNTTDQSIAKSESPEEVDRQSGSTSGSGSVHFNMPEVVGDLDSGLTEKPEVAEMPFSYFQGDIPVAYLQSEVESKISPWNTTSSGRGALPFDEVSLDLQITKITGTMEGLNLSPTKNSD